MSPVALRASSDSYMSRQFTDAVAVGKPVCSSFVPTKKGLFWAKRIYCKLGLTEQ